MAHRNAKLTPQGRWTLVQRVLAGSPVAHVAQQMGVSRQCAHRWMNRYQAEGRLGLEDRSSKPNRSPNQTSREVVEEVIAIRLDERIGRDEIALRVGVGPSTASRIIRNAGLPSLWELDPLTGIRIRQGRRTNRRYERAQPGDLIHIDVKKLGRIPDGGGWRLAGPNTLDRRGERKQRVGFDYIHVAIDDHSRLAFAQALPDEKGDTCAAFLTAAAAFFADHDITVREVMTDNAWCYRHSRAFQAAIDAIGATHLFIRPRSPWQNGKAERFHRTLQEGWAYRQPFTNNDQRTKALTPWLNRYNYTRPHTACQGQPPISRASTTS